VALAVALVASVTVTVKWNLPFWVESVPVSVPVESSVIPGGRSPGSGVDHV
jgi:hypothetical protein